MDLERMTGIEPAQAAWKAAGLPLTYIRISILLVIARAAAPPVAIRSLLAPLEGSCPALPD